MAGGFREAARETPATPRPLTAEIERDAARHGKTLRIFGAIWGLLGLAVAAGMSIAGSAAGVSALGVQAPFWGLVGVVGAALWLAGFLKNRSALQVFRDGVEASATVVEVKQNVYVRVNGRHPWNVHYEFTTPGGETHRGVASYWTERPDVDVGESVTVLHDPQAPSRSVLWTPIEPEQRKRVRVDTEARVEAL